MFILDGKTLPPGVPFEHDGIKYPANWLYLSSLEEKEAIGIQEVPDPAIYDPRFYWGYDSEGNLIPKDHGQLVTTWSNNTRATAGSFLLPSDWMVVRQVDNGTQMPEDWRQWRESIRLAAGTKVAAIEATTTTDELAAYVTGFEYQAWPLDPSFEVIDDTPQPNPFITE